MIDAVSIANRLQALLSMDPVRVVIAATELMDAARRLGVGIELEYSDASGLSVRLAPEDSASVRVMKGAFRAMLSSLAIRSGDVPPPLYGGTMVFDGLAVETENTTKRQYARFRFVG